MNISRMSRRGRGGCREVAHLSDVNLKKHKLRDALKEVEYNDGQLLVYVRPLAAAVFARSFNCYHVRAWTSSIKKNVDET